MSTELQRKARHRLGASIARRAGITRTMRLADGTEYTVLQDDIYQHALAAASDLLRRQLKAKRGMDAAAADPVGAHRTE